MTLLANLAHWDQMVRQVNAGDAVIDDRQHAFDDPEWFLRYKLQCGLLTPKQAEIAWSIKENPNTAVKGANSTGKDFTTGRMVDWWLYVHDKAVAIVYGPTDRQVTGIIWRNTRDGFRQAVGGLPGYMYPKAARYEVDDERYAYGFSAQSGNSAQSGAGIQGFHSPNMLVIVTEAQAVSDAEIESLLSLGPDRLVLTGNPLSTSGEFFRAFHGQRALWNCITISGFDSPNVIEGRTAVPGLATNETIKAWADRYGIDSPVYKARVLGEFPDNTEDNIISLAQMDAAVDRVVSIAGRQAVLGVDVAWMGEDFSVIYRRQGAIARKVYKVNGRPTTHLAGKIMEMCREDPLIETVVVDVIGFGAGVYDILKLNQTEGRLRNVRLIPFNGAHQAARKDRYLNRIAEAWWRLREAIDDLDIEADDDLISQVTTRYYEYHSSGRIMLEPKPKLKERGAPSPDEADALAMTFAVLDTGRKSTRTDRFSHVVSKHPLGLDGERYIDTDTGTVPN